MSQSGSPTGARLLLKRLRNIMAQPGTPQARLDQIVRIIAGDMVAEVCSTYVMRAGQVLELFATEGLKQEAVHNTRLRVGEGLVGDIASHARPLVLADAQHHPQFAYRPETGEEIYQSWMGVPILRFTAHRVLTAPYHRNQSGMLTEMHIGLAGPQEAEAFLNGADVAVLAFCPDDLQTRQLARLKPEGLYAHLLRGAIPPYLEPLPSNGKTGVRFFRFRPK